MTNHTYDARPDNADFRDLLYQPSLINVPAEMPIGSWYRRKIPVLDQGTEGSCVGHGLATIAHYLLRSRVGQNDATLISPQMLYNMAKIYDRWPGQAYSGSSCRAGVRGWHKHGICSEALWAYGTDDEVYTLTSARSADAAKRPLGAYYRVNTDDLTHMHAALAEVGVLYVSARVHKGWQQVGSDGAVDPSDEMIGGHAFAIVGYDERGFWIQNSWGESWGQRGCGHVTYADWLKNGQDCWVLRAGVPIKMV